MGACIVSFNGDAFESYGKEQGYNANTSENSMFKYTSALNTLLKSERNSMYLSGNTVVFWSDKVGGIEDDVIGAFMKGDSPEMYDENQSYSHIDYNQRGTNEIRDIIKLIGNGVVVNVDDIKDNSVNMHILGLSPSNSRIFIRFWFKNSLREFVKLSNRHFEDTKLVRKSRDDKSKVEEVGVKISYILKTITVSGKVENVPNTLINSLFKSILTGESYPMSIYNSVLIRIRSESGDKLTLNHTRVSFIKGYLKRYYRLQGLKDKEEEVTVALNLNSTNTGYNLGRVFAILEKIQSDSSSSNSGIREKYLSVASSTPRSIFPILLNLSQHHISKINKTNNTNFNYYDKIIVQILLKVEEFPSILSHDDQGMFMLGYYHQREDIFTKKENKGDN